MRELLADIRSSGSSDQTPGVDSVDFLTELLSDFQMRRLVQVSLEKFSVPITAFLSDAAVVEDCCLGISFDHLEQDYGYWTGEGAPRQTSKVLRAWKEGRYWLVGTLEGNYVIASFKRSIGKAAFLILLQSLER